MGKQSAKKKLTKKGKRDLTWVIVVLLATVCFSPLWLAAGEKIWEMATAKPAISEVVDQQASEPTVEPVKEQKEEELPSVTETNKVTPKSNDPYCYYNGSDGFQTELVGATTETHKAEIPFYIRFIVSTIVLIVLLFIIIQVYFDVVYQRRKAEF